MIEEEQSSSRFYAWYVVGILTVAYIFSFIDRQILNLLVEQVKQDLQLSDTQISLLQGLAFALFYTIMGIPIARLADVGSRRFIISVGIFFWSLATAVCGLASSFAQLFAARIGVGIGEAALSPPAYSMFSDYFPANQVTRAIAVYTGGSFLGAGLAYIIGGVVVDYVSSLGAMHVPVLGQLQAWQLAFITVGLPGVILALVVYLTVREPERKGMLEQGADSLPKGIPVKEIVTFLIEHRRTYVCHLLGTALFVMMLYAIMSWTPAFFIRVHGWTSGEVGFAFGFILLIFGTLGVVGAGWIADALRRRGRTDANLLVVRAGALCSVPFGIATFLVTNPWLALALMVPLVFFTSLPHGIAPAALQPITPNQMRAQVSALYLLAVNLIGLGLGPTVVALLTDYVFGESTMVGESLAVVVLVTGLSSVLVITPGLNAYRQDFTVAKNGWKSQAPNSGV